MTPDVDGLFSRENSAREVNDINVRNAEVRTLYIHAAAFGISLLTRFKIPSITTEVRKYVPFSIPTAFRQ